MSNQEHYRKSITFIAQFPPPIHGLSKAVETLYQSRLNQKYRFYSVNLSDNRCLLHNIVKLCFNKSDLYYFTISQTKLGNLRDLFILSILRFQRKYCIVHLHGGYYRYLVDYILNNWQKRLNYMLINHLEGCIVLGDSLKSNFQGMIDNNKLFIVPNCVEDRCVMNDNRFKMKLSELEHKKCLSVLYLSNFIPSKGYYHVLELARHQKRVQSNSFRFHFAGSFFDKKEESHFFNFIKDNNLEGTVKFHGLVDADEKLSLLEECDIFVLLTRYTNEGQPISIMEAMANGLVIVSTDHAGIPDIVTDRNGLICQKESNIVGETWDYMTKMNNNRGMLKEIAVQNRDRMLLNFTERHYIDNMERVFDSILS